MKTHCRLSVAFLAWGALTVSVAHADYLVDNAGDPLMTGLSIPADAATRGMWSAVKPWPLIGLHAALMPSGVVMTFGSPLGNGVQDGRTFDIWDPAKGFDGTAHYTLPQAQQVDAFCSAGTFLKTGAMLISGGSSGASGYSSNASTLFDPSTHTASNAVAALNLPRWYGTMITVPDGRALMLGGAKPYVVDAYKDPAAAIANNNVSMTPEIFAPETGWTLLSGATSRTAFGPDDNRWWYPHAWVAPSGSVFGISANRLWSLDVAGNGAIRDLGTFKGAPGNGSTTPNVGATSTAVMYAPGKILQVGGNGVANQQPTASSNQATVIDINGTQPSVRDTAPMTYPRQWASSIVTPDGKVVVTGGSKFADDAGTSAVYPAEIWSPATGRWTVAAKAAVYRGYHSTTLLLPDGAILSTGGGVPGPVNNFNAEVFYPPYLFQSSGGRSVLAARPAIYSLNSNKQDYGAGITIRLTRSASLSKVVLIGASSSTHSFNSTQRYLELPFTVSGTTITARSPSSRNLAPPGYYLLYVMDAKGVPSRGVLISLGSEWTAPPVQPAQPKLTVDASVSLAPVNFPGYLVRHKNYVATIDQVSQTSDALAKLDSAFTVRTGLADAACYSFESRNFPGYFLKADNGAVGLKIRNNADAAYAGAATFCARKGMNGTGYSFESRAYPGQFLRHQNYVLQLQTFDGTPLFKDDSSFSVVPALL
ncbi:AbfB domain-containing protein [Oryzibacter oryziterrae]|uniref:AbfB domain-containing protein n=1 Tax=Oryzibacter oryziterrae TaxID=2766474 RepID=UPI001EFFD4D5|nr:AbfB domain-containing protein [Oryzibacter oryziterrae]